MLQESPERPALSQPSPPDAAPEEMEVPEPVQPTTPKGGTEIPKGGTEIPEVPKDKQPTTPPKDGETATPPDLLVTGCQGGMIVLLGASLTFFEKIYLAKIQISNGVPPFQNLVNIVEEYFNLHYELQKTNHDLVEATSHVPNSSQ